MTQLRIHASLAAKGQRQDCWAGVNEPSAGKEPVSVTVSQVGDAIVAAFWTQTLQYSEVIFWAETVVVLMARVRAGMNVMFVEKCIVNFAFTRG